MSAATPPSSVFSFPGIRAPMGPALPDRRCMTGTQRYSGNEEPALSDLLADPMVRLLMDSDGVNEDCLSRLIAQIKGRLHEA